MYNKKKIKINGGHKLEGNIYIGGSKNSISTLLPALCLINGEQSSVIENVPNIKDVTTLCCILEEIGFRVERDKDKNIIRLFGKIQRSELSEDYVPKIRASNLFLGAIVSSMGSVKMPFCGGDMLGVRPLDIHFYVLEKFKIKVEIEDGKISCQVTEFPLKGTTIFLRYPSVGATENAIILASKAEGETTIYNAACEPEITDLVIALNKMGANITGAGTSIIKIKGVRELTSLKHEIIPDRLETGTFILAFIVTKGKGIIRNTIPEHNIALISTLKDAGVDLTYSNSDIYIDATNRVFNPINISTLPYPGMPTDMQPMLSVFAILSNGNSIINEGVFQERFAYVSEYQKMGIKVVNSYNQLFITGPQKFQNAIVTGNDIRMVTCLILASLTAKSESFVYGVEHLERGYDNFIEKLKTLGAEIEIVE